MIGSKTGEISKIDVKDVVEHVHDEKISREVMTSSAAIFLPPSFSSSPNRADLEIRSRSSRKRRRFGVSVSNLSVKGSIQSSNQQSTFVNTGLLRSLSSLWRKTTDSTSSSCILNNVDGVVKKGEMLMVLGQPGSGCSTLLKVLSGELHGLKIAEATQLHYEGKSTLSIYHPVRFWL